MTAPVSHGYPDFGRYAAWADKVYFQQEVTDIDGATNYGPFFVGDVEYISLNFEPAINNFQVNMRFFPAAGGGSEIGAFTFSCRTDRAIDQVIPVRGPYLVMTVTPSAVNSSFIATVASCPLHHSGDRSNLVASQLVSENGTAVGAGATVLTLAAATRQGPAVWSARSALATWTARLETLDYLGVVTVLDSITQLSNEVPRPVYLPPATTRIAFVNTTGGAGTFFAYMSTALMLTSS